jgi:hypothetical protein
MYPKPNKRLPDSAYVDAYQRKASGVSIADIAVSLGRHPKYIDTMVIRGKSIVERRTLDTNILGL